MIWVFFEFHVRLVLLLIDIPGYMYVKLSANWIIKKFGFNPNLSCISNLDSLF